MPAPEQYYYDRRDGFDPRCCATCCHAILRGGRGRGGLRRWCALRQAFLPLKERARLRYNGCDGHELDTASAEAMAIWNRLAPDTDGWSERDFVPASQRGWSLSSASTPGRSILSNLHLSIGYKRVN